MGHRSCRQPTCCLPDGTGLPGTHHPGSTQHLVQWGRVAVSATVCTGA